MLTEGLNQRRYPHESMHPIAIENSLSCDTSDVNDLANPAGAFKIYLQARRDIALRMPNRIEIGPRKELMLSQIMNRIQP
jgi:hypothetical protein